ncbi:MAG: hypothetical protein DCF15_05935 [Phormidesmis priestleyi]|uniref:Uncharacterized protein n=1 Tax=Phormidesmis priestleyi TaxID=268141 RepID=A0A2W4XUB7_9CYAN|nr:MAG: hypothetical protein DCF15_05935 [Phormidesmis priestleyi]
MADLVSLHDGQYIVRAVITHKGDVLATGLAAHTDVSMAEDQARERAIAALGIPHLTASKSPTTPAENAPINDPSHDSASVQSNDLQSSDLQSNDLLDEPAEEDFGPPIDIIDDDPNHHSSMDEGLMDEGSMEAVPPAKPSVATLALESYTNSVHPVDLSDVMAQTSVELTRLGWTSEQGREYLERTYGKRSRHQLTDEELMSFLLHLEDQ